MSHPDDNLDDLAGLVAVADGAVDDELESRAQADDNDRRLRIYRIPYRKLESLINYPSILESTENAPVTFMVVPNRLALPPDAKAIRIRDDTIGGGLEVVVWSGEFDVVEDGSMPPHFIEKVTHRPVIAAAPEYYAEIERMANCYKEVLKLEPRKHSPSFRWVMRADPSMNLYRICRYTYEVGYPRSPGWHAIQWTFGLVPTFFKFRREGKSWILRVLGLRIHRKVCYGGRPD